MSNNKSRYLLRKTGSHKVYEPISSTLDDERMVEISKLIVSMTGKLEFVYQVSAKFLEFVDQYKTNPQLATELSRSSGLDLKSVTALMEYFSTIESRVDAETLIHRMFKAKKW